VGATLYDLTVMEYQNFVCSNDSAQPVCYCNCRSPFQKNRQSVLNLCLDFAVHGARRLVEKQERSVSGYRPRKGKQLALTDAQ
jgi:hypothetical protein